MNYLSELKKNLDPNQASRKIVPEQQEFQMEDHLSTESQNDDGQEGNSVLKKIPIRRQRSFLKK